MKKLVILLNILLILEIPLMAQTLQYEYSKLDTALTLNGESRGVLAGDIRGDGKNRIVVGTFDTGTLSIYSYQNGNYIKEWQDQVIPASEAKAEYYGGIDPIAIGDIDNDGINEILVNVEGKNELVIYKWNGTTYQRIFDNTVYGSYKAAQVCDIDNDGKNEIIMNTPNITVYRYNSLSNTLDTVWTYSEGISTGLQLAVGDVDNDGQKEIVFPTGNFSTNQYYITIIGYSNGNYFLKSKLGPYNLEFSGIAIGDINGDGRNEILASTFNVVSNSYPVYSFSYMDSAYTFSFRELCNSGVGTFKISIGDLNGDGKKEAVIFKNGNGALVIGYASGNYEIGETYPIGACVFGDVKDVNEDGKDEIIGANYSNVDIVSVSNSIPKVNLLSPSNYINLKEYPFNVTFSWQQFSNAQNYEIQISNDPNFNSINYDIYNPQTSNAISFQNAGTYYWRVRPYVNNNWGAWSDVWNFNLIDNRTPIAVLYECNMQIEELGGRFNPATDYVELRGTAFGWGPGVRMQQDPNNPYLYYYEATQYLSAGDSLPEYKFWYSKNDSWEYGSNRTYIVTQQDVNNGKILISRYFDDLTFSTVTNTTTKILYTIDTKNAHDVFGNPITVPINTLDLNGSSIPLTWNGWIYNDINYMSPMYDDGTHGDSTAGDGIYSREVVFNPYTPFHVEYEYVINFVQSGFIPYENQSGDNHIINLEQNLYSATAYNVYGFMSSVTGITPLVDKVYLPKFELNNADTLLTRLLTNTNKDLNEALSKASTELNNSLDTSYWADNLNLNEKGQKVFEDTKKAAEELITSLKKGTSYQLIRPIIDDIYYGDLYIVDILLDELKNNSMNLKVADNNDYKKDKDNRFNSIQKELSDAGLKYSKGNYADAVEELKSAWQDLMDISREQNQIMDKRSLVENKEIEMNNLPKEFKLNQNYPNPFNPTTTINYSVPKESFVTLKVYDVLGNEVSSLVNEGKSPGYYSVQFSAVNNKLASGIYFYRMQAGNYIETKKLILMK